jgi:hypothetical protein
MFEKETEHIISAVKHNTPHSITDPSMYLLKDILAADIPYAVKTFFRADVEILLAEELHRQRKSTRFNYEHPEVRNLQHQITSVLVMNYGYPRKEFYERLDGAVHMIVNYLVRPQWTLANVIFEGESQISSAALMRLLRYFGPYEYLRSLLLRFIEDKRVATFSKEDFALLLWKVDGHFIRRKTGYEVARIVSALFEFLEYPASTGEDSIPIRGLMKYFADKGLTSAVHRLHVEVERGTDRIKRHDLGELLEDIRRTSGAFEVERVEHLRSSGSVNILEMPQDDEPLHGASAQHVPHGERPADGTIDAHEEADIIESELKVASEISIELERERAASHAPAIPEEKPKPEPAPSFWPGTVIVAPPTDPKPAAAEPHPSPDFLHHVSSAPAGIEPEAAPAPTLTPVPLAERPAPSAQPVQAAAPAPPPSPRTPTASSALPSLMLYMSEGEKRKFVKRIFKQEEMAFLDALRRIDQITSWRQASVFIDEIFIANDVDPYSSEAIRFIDIVQEKFYPKR